MSNTNGRGFWWGDSSHTNAQGAMALTTQGYLTVASRIRVGYGESDTTTPSHPLDVSGNIVATGNVTAYSSDERLKTNITPIENPIEKVKQLNGVEFDWKDNVEELGFTPRLKHETGVIAQNIQSVIPDATPNAPFNEEYLTVQHEKIIPVLIEAIKEQQKQIEELKNALRN
jgi:hypothetical protein